MLKIFALNPPYLPKFSRQSRSPCVAKGGTIYYPYYLAYAVGALEKEGHEVRFVDGVTFDWSHDDAVAYAKEFKPNLIILESSTPSIRNDIEVAKKLKAVVPNAHLTMVNTHPTNVPEWTLAQTPAINSVCRGEYDYIAVDLAKALQNKDHLSTVPGISFQENGSVTHNEKGRMVENLDELPWVSKVYMKHFGEKIVKKYFYASITWPEIQMLTGRGCPYNCHFCNIPAKKSYRMRSVADVVGEFKWIQENMPFLNEIMIEDDTFPVYKDRTIELCDELIKNNIKITWSCNARVNMDTETMKKMKEAGCRLMCVGFESPIQSSLNGVIKGTTADMQRKFMKEVDDVGLYVNGCFILGLPTDTPESMQATIEFAKELNPNTAQFYPLMVYPGTGSYKWAEQKGYLTNTNFDDYLTDDGLHFTPVSRPELSNEELLNWCNKARLEFYTGRRYITKMIRQAATSPTEAVRIAKGSKALFGHLFKYMTSKDAKVKAAS